MEPFELTATAALALIEAGELSSREVVLSCLRRIEQRDPAVRAWTYLDPTCALAQAQERDENSSLRPLRGLPVGIKDIIDVAGMPTSYNSPIYAEHRPAKDAACVGTARHGGAVIMGKTDTVEFAFAGRKASTRNPHNLAHTPGASSSGSAAAVADFMVPLAFGTQTAGSVIRPAAFTGVYAFKPSYGAVSMEGCKPSSPSFDTLGWFARCVDDLILGASAFRLMESRASPHTAPIDLKKLRIGLCRTPHWDRSEPAAKAALQGAAERLAAEGAVVIDLNLPPLFDRLAEAHRLIMRHENRASLLMEYLAHPNELSGDLRAAVESAGQITGEAIAEAHDRVSACQIAFDEIFRPHFDVVMTLAAPGPAPEGLQTTGDPIFNSLWTALHVPCVAMPAGRDARGLPLGVQLVGRRLQDSRLLAAAKAAAIVIELEGTRTVPA